MFSSYPSLACAPHPTAFPEVPTCEKRATNIFFAYPLAKDSQAPHSSASLSTDSLILLYTQPEQHLRACTPPLVFLLKAIINHLPFVSRLSAYFANVFSLLDHSCGVERGLL